MAPEERDEMRSGGRNYMPREQRRKKQVGVSECTSSDAARTKKKPLTGISGFLGSCSIFTRLADMGDMQMHLEEEKSKMPRRE